MPALKIKARFVEPMLLESTVRLPEGASWVYELKLDGYRAEAIRSGGRVCLRSRNDKDFNIGYPTLVQALAAMPDETVVDGEIVALDESGRPSFTALRNHGSAAAALVYYAFDVMVLAGKDVMSEPLNVRRELLREHVLSKVSEPIRESLELAANLPDLVRQSARSRRVGGQTERQPLRARSALGRVAKYAHQSRTTAGDRGIHALWQDVRCDCVRLL